MSICMLLVGMFVEFLGNNGYWFHNDMLNLKRCQNAPDFYSHDVVLYLEPYMALCNDYIRGLTLEIIDFS